jgi:hypothetical protein
VVGEGKQNRIKCGKGIGIFPPILGEKTKLNGILGMEDLVLISHFLGEIMRFEP